MPYAVALRTFRGRYGFIQAGEKFNCEEGYFKQLAKNRLVELAKPGTEAPADPGPSKDRNIPQAPGRGGNEAPGGQGNPPAETTDPTLTGGAVLTSASLPAGQASRGKTLMPSGAGARKGTPTPRKPKGAGA